MARGISDKVSFRAYDQSQTELIPPSADEVIPQDHLVRVVNGLLDSVSIEPLLRRYERGGGASR